MNGSRGKIPIAVSWNRGFPVIGRVDPDFVCSASLPLFVVVRSIPIFSVSWSVPGRSYGYGNASLAGLGPDYPIEQWFAPLFVGEDELLHHRGEFR